MKKYIFTALTFLITGSIFAQEFNSLAPVRVGPRAPAQYDVYVIGDGSQSYTSTRWITPFEINRYETTYELWYENREIAEALGYKFINPGQEGSRGKRGAEPTNDKDQPVTMISWYDAVIWCNAFSEIHAQIGRAHV